MRIPSVVKGFTVRAHGRLCRRTHVGNCRKEQKAINEAIAKERRAEEAIEELQKQHFQKTLQWFTPPKIKNPPNITDHQRALAAHARGGRKESFRCNDCNGLRSRLGAIAKREPKSDGSI